MFCNKKEMSFLKISDPLKRDSIVKEYLELKKKFRIISSQRESENNNYKLTFQSFISLLLKHKKLQRERLQKDLNLLVKDLKLLGKKYTIYQILFQIWKQ